MIDFNTKRIDIAAIDEADPKQLYYRSGLSRAEFAGLMGVSLRTVDSWIGGYRPPSTVARRLAYELQKSWNL
jgi:DNA-binding transcriptional regulator YiaG